MLNIEDENIDTIIHTNKEFLIVIEAWIEKIESVSITFTIYSN